MAYKDQVRGSLDTSPGFMVRAEGMPHRTATPSWDHETRIRVFPAPVDGGGFSPLREGCDEFEFGDAVWSEPVARCLGTQEQFTYVTRIPGKTGDDPTKRFCKALLSIIDEKPRDVPEAWLLWPKGGKKQAAKLAKIKSCIFFQGMQVMQQGKILTDSANQPHPLWPVLFMGSVSLQMSFEAMANARTVVPNTNPEQLAYTGPMPASVPGTDEVARQQRDAIYAQMFQIGDWCSLEAGRILSIFQAPASGKFERPHYAITPLEPLPLTQIAEQIRKVWKPWSEVLRYHTAEQQIQYLSRAFPAEAVDYVFGASEYRDAMPVRVKGAWQNYTALNRGWAPGFGQGVAQSGRVPTGMPQGVPQGVPQGGAPMGTGAQGGAPMGTGAPAPTGGPLQSAPPTSTAPQSQPQTNPTAGAPAQPSTPVVGGYDLGGGVEGGANAGSSIMGSGAFGQTPVEFSQPQAAGAAPAALPAQPTQGTPPEATSGAAVDGGKLSAALTDLKKSRDAAAGGNLGS